MKTKLTLIILGIFLVGIASAYYPCETIIVNNTLGDNLVYTITGNESPINLDIEVNSSKIKIYFPCDIPPESFYLTFIEEQTKEKEIVYVNSGGSSRTKYIDNDIIEYIEVPNYISVNNTYPEGEVKEVEKKFIEEDKGKFVLYGIFILLGILIGIGVLILWFKLKRLRKI